MVIKTETLQKTKEVTKTVLKVLAAAGLVVSVLAFPGLAIMLDWLDKEVNGRPQSVNRAFYRLRKKGMIKVKRRQGKIEVILSEKGKRHLLKYQIQEMKLKKPAIWDGRFRLVMFDVPESHRSDRDRVRQRLRRLGFLAIQKSVFIHPYPCQEAVEILRSHYYLDPGQLYVFESKVLEGERVLKKHFGL